MLSVLPHLLATVSSWTLAVTLAAGSDAKLAAAIGAVIAGCFALLNTFLNARLLRGLKETQQRLHEKRVSVRDQERDVNIVAYEPDLRKARRENVSRTDRPK